MSQTLKTPKVAPTADEPRPEGVKSYVRIKLWIAIFLSNFTMISIVWLYLTSGGTLEQVSLKQIAMFLLAVVATFYVFDIKCEKCKTVWWKPKYPPPKKAAGLIRDIVSAYTVERDYEIEKVCRHCGLERH